MVRRTRLLRIPADQLCPVDRGGCGAGRLRSCDVDEQGQPGPYKRHAQYRCPRCGFSERRYEDFVGVEVDEELDSSDYNPSQPSLFG